MEKLGLAPHTGRIIESVSKLDCIKPFVLVGGTALSIQLGTRQSEDLDFMRWKEGPDDKLEVGWPEIKKQLETVGNLSDTNVLDLDQVEFIVDGVKLSFYAAPRYKLPTMQEIPYLNNIRLADVKSIGVMKLETMSRRRNFRDYYDIFSILEHGCDINEMIPLALSHSGHRLKSKHLISILINGVSFIKDKGFALLNPLYDVDADYIENYIKSKLVRDIKSVPSLFEENQGKNKKDLVTNPVSSTSLHILLKQYVAFKLEHPNLVPLFHIGDGYETYQEDARRVSSALGFPLQTSPMHKDPDGNPVVFVFFPEKDLEINKSNLLSNNIPFAFLEDMNRVRPTPSAVSDNPTNSVREIERGIADEHSKGHHR